MLINSNHHTMIWTIIDGHVQLKQSKISLHPLSARISFVATLQVTHEEYGVITQVDLIPDGANVLVNKENR